MRTSLHRRLRPPALTSRGGVSLVAALVGLAVTTGFPATPELPLPAAISSAQRRPAGGTIRGRVDLRRATTANERRPTVAAFGDPAQRLRVESAPAVVYLDSAPRGAFEQVDPGRAVMDQQDETFVPHVLAVTTGTVVDFPNSDRIYHNVFSLSKVRRFDLGRYAAGRSESVRFDRPGVVRVFCDIHSHMNAFILVFAHRFFALTDSDGHYRIEGVPAGNYSVVAWHEGRALDPKAAAVPAGGAAELDFDFR
jgi:plastocyanin